MSEREMVRRATVAKVLRDRRPGDALNEYIQDARAILEALDGQGESIPTGEFAGELVEGDFGLTAEQEIRARAADSAARLLGPIFAAMVRVAADDAPDDLMQLISNTWADSTRGAARYIETGAEPLPSQESAVVPGAGKAKEYCAQCTVDLATACDCALARCADCKQLFCCDAHQDEHIQLGNCPGMKEKAA